MSKWASIRQERKKMQKAKKVNKKDSNIDDAISHILGVLDSLESRILSLEEFSHQPMDFVDDVDILETRLSKVEGRMGL